MLGGMMLFGLVAAPELAAQAAQAFTPNVSQLPLPPQLFVGSQAPGTVLFTSTLAQSRKIEPGAPIAAAFSTSLPGGVPVPGYANVYTTNIPGIGIRFGNILYTNANPSGVAVDGVGAAAHGLDATLPQQRVRFMLVRIPGNVVPGTLQITLPYRVAFNCGSAINCVWNISATGSTAVTAGTCTMPASIPVQLGDHRVNDFRAAGTASPWVDFNVALRNCPAGYTRLSYRLTPSLVPVADGLLALAPGGATGVAVEVWDQMLGQRAKFSTAQQRAVAAGTPDVDLPFRARILQTDAVATPGDVEASMEVRIEYL